MLAAGPAPLQKISIVSIAAMHSQSQVRVSERTRYPRERAARGAGANGADRVIK